MGNHNKASLASLSCFSQNSKAYNFSSNENMTRKLNLITHFETIFLGIQFFLWFQSFQTFQNCKATIYEYGVCKLRFETFVRALKLGVKWELGSAFFCTGKMGFRSLGLGFGSCHWDWEFETKNWESETCLFIL